ncbi:MAG TPA: type I-U CRISPR-associated protein Csx17 [Myxococcales bacterium]|nr:type I-U CRISPR-associated protein Csx17 [Deltaproteobacteria bacterium]HAA54643.1 type I-U CRISPR-associated protein Csx17 [Myxococcales bacterium]|tara:strand:+ start:4333 stop:6567 length:2235 start_codon:yes stop_codon:yes gene_type:complete
MNDLKLSGCRSLPLAHYLKSLGLLRLLSEQHSSECRGFWRDETFYLRTELTQDQIISFFLESYKPTPILAPWNGGSGFAQKDKNQRAVLDDFVGSNAPRFASIKDNITRLQDLLESMGLTNKPEKEEKPMVLRACRNVLPDESLEWLDAAYVLTTKGPKFPPLLGTGGNDGRLEFSNNFLQRIQEVFSLEDGAPTPLSEMWLRGALFDETTWALLSKKPIGQFFPKAVGKFNATTGFEADSLINPWDFILMLEGAMSFAASAVKRFQNGMSAVSTPFTVHSSHLGHGTAALGEGSRAEMWMPIWSEACSYKEIHTLFSEGRVQIGRRTAAKGIDFAKAVVTLGVERGIVAFERYGFHERNGLAYFAVPLGRFDVKAEQKDADLVLELDDWMRKMEGRVSSWPEGVRRLFRLCEESIFELCRDGGSEHITKTFILLGRLEKTFALRTDSLKGCQPVPPLSGRWLSGCEMTPELRLAASLASLFDIPGSSRVPIRQHFEPVSVGWRGSGKDAFAKWNEKVARHEIVWREGDIVGTMNEILQRRLQKASTWETKRALFSGRIHVREDDLIDFIDGNVDESLLCDLLWSCLLINPHELCASALQHKNAPKQNLRKTPMFYNLLKSCFSGYILDKEEGKITFTNIPKKGKDDESQNKIKGTAIPLVAGIHRLAMRGRGAEASVRSVRRLRASGFVPALDSLAISGDRAARIAAALLFPISAYSLMALVSPLFRKHPKEDKSEEQTTITV